MTLLYSVQAREGQASSSSGDRLSCPRDGRDTASPVSPGPASPSLLAVLWSQNISTRKASRGLPGDNLPELGATARVPASQARSQEQMNATVLAPGLGRADLTNLHMLRCISPAAGAAATVLP
ncbi:unnamed protein product [Rangifer tarandus platyrhynchus]|uniref:Uncharacterized protein n=1 Tax=Rangifer tarandus platyrhynchus TaxID=3082113 RepID=A0ABN8ZV77_RANTA|nr:unnamed protein product [Rangifer tarandus platyrhynchus]